MRQRKNLSVEANHDNSPARRVINPITAAGLLLIIVAASALFTYFVLVAPSRFRAESGPPEEFRMAATQQAASLDETRTQSTATPADTDTGIATSPTPTLVPANDYQSATPSTDNFPLTPTFSATENPYGDWPLSENTDVAYWLSIPNLGLEAPIIALAPRERVIDGRGVRRLPVPNSYSVSWDLTSSEPGFQGNAILTGHNNLYGGVFSRLSAIQPGWEIAVWSEYGVFSYYVQETLLIEEENQPLDVRLDNGAVWLNDTLDDRLTIITCGPGRESTHRLIVVATR